MIIRATDNYPCIHDLVSVKHKEFISLLLFSLLAFYLSLHFHCCACSASIYIFMDSLLSNHRYQSLIQALSV